MTASITEGAVGEPLESRLRHPAGEAVIKEGYHDSLTNEDLAPLRRRTWNAYNYLAFWMADIHSVGGYVTAGSLFALGIASWQVLVCLVIGIVLVMFLTNAIAKPSERTGVPYPVMARSVFGVIGANIPALVRGIIAVAWYGVQTYLASSALDMVILKFIPASQALTEVFFLGLNALGWISYAILWVAQAAVFWTGMETIRRFIDWAGPAVYVVMLALTGYLLVEAGGVQAIDLSVHTGEQLGFAESIPVMISAIALVVSYFAGPMLNFGDFSRYARGFGAVKRGNFWGLPVNYLFFSILTVVTASLTVPVYGELITDPIATVQRIDSGFAILLGGLTFVIATVGINIVANFISPAFDFSHVAPKRISWRAGGLIAAIGSVILTPWNWYGNAQAIHYTLDLLGALIGPLFGILIAGYYVVSRQRIVVDDLFSRDSKGHYWFYGGVNPNAVWATVIGGVCSITAVLLTAIAWLATYSWIIGAVVGFASFLILERVRPMIRPVEPGEGVSDGRVPEPQAVVDGTDL